MKQWYEEEIAGSKLSTRARNMLIRDGYRTMQDCLDAGIEELSRTPEVGEQTLHEIIGWMYRAFAANAPRSVVDDSLVVLEVKP